MSRIAIKAQGISKKYLIGARQQRRDSLREIISRSLSEPFKRAWRIARGEAYAETNTEILWALKDVEFEIEQGDTMGVIGRNGAGKSTLLKLLSRITEPTMGSIALYGRVGALLEVGTGFHPELTGKENIYLNGAVLGMSRTEINRKFDEIVDFAGMERFMNTPVKRYSSGMALRLGFAVAAHLETEILIVDEVLAVGDAEFQRKCLGRMESVAGEGRTVLFVSHNLNAVLNLCKHAMYLRNGKLVSIGKTHEVMQEYTNLVDNHTILGQADLISHEGRQMGMATILHHIRLLNESGTPITDCATGDTITLEIGFDTEGKTYDYIQLSIMSTFGERLCTVSTLFSENAPKMIHGHNTIHCILPNIPLNEGDYSVTVLIGSKTAGIIDIVESAMSFRVWFNDYFRTGTPLPNSYGYFVQPSIWRQLS